MTAKKHENAELLFFLNAIMKTVLDSLEGEFKETAKYKFGKVVRGVDDLERTLLGQCERPAQETYSTASVAFGSLLNKAISAYSEGHLKEFLTHCNTFRNGKKD